MPEIVHYGHLPAGEKSAKARADVKAWLGDELYAKFLKHIEGKDPETIIFMCGFVGIRDYPARVMAGLEK